MRATPRLWSNSRILSASGKLLALRASLRSSMNFSISSTVGAFGPGSPRSNSPEAVLPSLFPRVRRPRPFFGEPSSAPDPKLAPPPPPPPPPRFWFLQGQLPPWPPWRAQGQSPPLGLPPRCFCFCCFLQGQLPEPPWPPCFAQGQEPPPCSASPSSRAGSTGVMGNMWTMCGCTIIVMLLAASSWPFFVSGCVKTTQVCQMGSASHVPKRLVPLWSIDECS
mmetsp:Transcript_96813/g.269447  ORF Transcript_96813/g.269447 Transcript_96813/m.269447 type:complete len:222 (-) Transcript_96813:815-1480(-)